VVVPPNHAEGFFLKLPRALKIYFVKNSKMEIQISNLFPSDGCNKKSNTAFFILAHESGGISIDAVILLCSWGRWGVR
jgi:hypothetical protein